MLPLIVVPVMGIVELSNALLDQHHILRLSLWTVLRLSR